MTTNLLCQIIITLVTNVLNGDNAGFSQELTQHGDYIYTTNVFHAASERYVTTEISKVATIHWTYEGVPGQSEVSRKTLSSLTQVLRLKQQWENAETRTNLVLTNVTITNLGAIFSTP